jgi:hypothetical protein
VQKSSIPDQPKDSYLLKLLAGRRRNKYLLFSHLFERRRKFYNVDRTDRQGVPKRQPGDEQRTIPRILPMCNALFTFATIAALPSVIFPAAFA